MKGLTFNATLPKYITTKILGSINKGFYYSPLSCVALKELPEPELPGEDWVKIKTLMGGICGSDINMVTLHDSPSTSPFVSFPLVMGHENLGEIVQKGSQVDSFEVGDRVTANPILSCKVRKVDECPSCRRGEFSLCQNITKGAISPGISIGFCRDTGGSWGEYYVAHQSQLHKVPDRLTDDQAILIDPLCSALHPVMRNFPENNEKVLVIGSGIIGLFTIACLRALESKSEITILAKHRFQGDKALEMGADRVIYSNEEYYDKFGEIVGGELYQPIIGKKVMMGGFDRIFDCVGSSTTLGEALKFTRAGGTVVLIGLAGEVRNIDLTPVWFKEITLRGTMYYNDEQVDSQVMNSQKRDAYAIGFDLITKGDINLDGMVTHKSGIDDYGKTFDIILNKRHSHCLKSVFTF